MRKKQTCLTQIIFGWCLGSWESLVQIIRTHRKPGSEMHAAPSIHFHPGVCLGLFQITIEANNKCFTMSKVMWTLKIETYRLKETKNSLNQFDAEVRKHQGNREKDTYQIIGSDRVRKELATKLRLGRGGSGGWEFHESCFVGSLKFLTHSSAS